MRINTNLMAMNTFTQYTANNNKIAGSIAKLSSGYAINSAADNAAGLAISEKMRAQIRGLTKASANAQDAISLVQTAEGSLGEATEILQRMRELAVQAASDTNQDEIDRAALQDEFAQLQQELNDIASTTTFNKKNLLDGSLAATKRTVTNVQPANSGMAVTVGKAAAGSYSFQVVVRQETAAIEAEKATVTAAKGSVASSMFSTVTTNGDDLPAGALYNGNYTLETSINDDNITVKAKGDNGQTFYATVKKSTIETLSAGDELQLNFSSSEKAEKSDFSVKLTLTSDPSVSDNGLETLKNAIDDITVSIEGGVNKQDATYGVYATLTGGEAVKLKAGDTSVTFSNGVTVSFNKLTATDVTVDQVPVLPVPVTYELDTPSDVDISGAITFKDNSGNNIISGLKLTVTDVNTSGASATPPSLIVKSVKVNDGKTDLAIVLTDGTNDYEGSVQIDTLKTLNNNSTEVTLKDNAGNEVKASISATADLASAADFEVGAEVKGDTAATLKASSTPVDKPSLAESLLTKLGSSDDVQNRNNKTPVSATETTKFDVVETAGKGLTFQVGANRGDEMVINLDAVNCQSLGINSANISTQEAASAAIEAVDNAINTVSSQRAYLGAIQNRLQYKINNLETSTENLTSAESQIRDVDMAKEMTEFTNANILQQAATAMLAQANSLPQNVLSLIRG